MDTQARRLEVLLAGEHHAAVKASWGVYQRLIQAYRTEDPGLGKYLMQRLIDSLRQAIPNELEEIQTLARTLTSRSQDILAYFDCPRTSNGPTPSDQRTPGAPTRHRPGLPQPGQLHHPQPHPRRTPQRPPNSNHLNPTTGPAYHTLKHEEPLYMS
ncbi:transposase [Actinomyces viscosus]|uniref:transposase n=1 Tax=Actinomyces viscosus TaxID=1656 RepID=UPI003CC871B9